LQYNNLKGITKEAKVICDEMRKNKGRRRLLYQFRQIWSFALDVLTNKLNEYVVAANSVAVKSKEEYYVWKRNFITPLEQGDPTWYDIRIIFWFIIACMLVYFCCLFI
jgi:hypothetical protein